MKQKKIRPLAAYFSKTKKFIKLNAIELVNSPCFFFFFFFFFSSTEISVVESTFVEGTKAVHNAKKKKFFFWLNRNQIKLLRETNYFNCFKKLSIKSNRYRLAKKSLRSIKQIRRLHIRK